MFDPGPCVYMEKIAAGPRPPTSIDLDAPVKANLEAVAKALGEQVSDVTAVILDRDRHADIIRECREAGARIRLIPDGDVAGAISVAWRNSGTDILFGIGGTPEGVIAACALKCARRLDPGPALAAQRRGAHAPRSTSATTSTGCSRSTTSCRGDDVFFAATGITDGELLQGVRYWGDGAQHAEPRDALEVGHDPHHRRDPPVDEAHVVLRGALGRAATAPARGSRPVPAAERGQSPHR